MNTIQTGENSFLNSSTVFKKVGPTILKCFSSTLVCAWVDIVLLTNTVQLPSSDLEITDIDECASGIYECVKNVTSCINTEGSYECVCKPGYTGDGKTSCLPTGEYK